MIRSKVAVANNLQSRNNLSKQFANYNTEFTLAEMFAKNKAKNLLPEMVLHPLHHLIHHWRMVVVVGAPFPQ